MHTENTIRFLQKAEVFQGLDRQQLLDISRLFKEITLKKGEPIVFMGDDSNSVYLIREGQCKVFVPFDYGMGENILSYLKRGDLFGEMGVITGHKRAANITCFTDVELLSMSGADFWKVAEQYQVILKNIIFILTDRLVARNIGKKAKSRASLNLDSTQRESLEYFCRFIESQSRTLINRMKTPKVPGRHFRWTPLRPLRSILRAALRLILNIITTPYILKIDGLENIPAEKPVIYLLSLRTFFDFLFLYKAHDQIPVRRKLIFAYNIDGLGKILLFFLRRLFSVLDISYLVNGFSTSPSGAEDAIKAINHMQSAGKKVDAALYPFLERSMRYDRMMAYHHLNIWLNTGQDRDIIPVAVKGTDKFWPFEPWNRRFFEISSFFNLKSVEITFGEKISLKDLDFKQKFDACLGDEEKTGNLFDQTNTIIGNRLAGLDGHRYTPMHNAAEQELLRSFNEKWSNRLSLMLPAGLGLRRKYKKASIKVRHFAWHAEMLNVLLDHLEEERYFLPVWAKGMLIAGASYADLEWPFYSMDHSYNPYTKKGMKLLVRFPDLMSLIRKDVDSLFTDPEKELDTEKLLGRLGRIYHYLSDLAVPAHVHNIPHMFLDLPKIGKCDFEEYLGLDQPLLTLNQHEIGDISAHLIESFDDFYQCLDKMARYNFLNSSFGYQQLGVIAKDRMISNYNGQDDLIRKLKRAGVSVLPVEGLSGEERFYVRNLTSHECEEISKKTTYYSLKAIAGCFLFLIKMVNDRLIKQGLLNTPKGES